MEETRKFYHKKNPFQTKLHFQFLNQILQRRYSLGSTAYLFLVIKKPNKQSSSHLYICFLYFMRNSKNVTCFSFLRVWLLTKRRTNYKSFCFSGVLVLSTQGCESFASVPGNYEV